MLSEENFGELLGGAHFALNRCHSAVNIPYEKRMHRFVLLNQDVNRVAVHGLRTF